MKLTKRQLKRIIREERRLLEATWADSWFEDPNEKQSSVASKDFQGECMETLDTLIGEGNAQGLSFPEIIKHIENTLAELKDKGI